MRSCRLQPVRDERNSNPHGHRQSNYDKSCKHQFAKRWKCGLFSLVTFDESLRDYNAAHDSKSDGDTIGDRNYQKLSCRGRTRSRHETHHKNAQRYDKKYSCRPLVHTKVWWKMAGIKTQCREPLLSAPPRPVAVKHVTCD